MFRWVEHTGELELEITAPTEAGIFADAFEAMRELLEPEGAGSSTHAVPITLSGDDRAVLLAEWIGELAFLAETEGLVPRRLASLEVGDDRVEAAIDAAAGSPAHLVKAVTYHRLTLAPAGDGWRATVVLDV